MSVKIRTFPESNYKAIYFNGKTIRFQIDGTKDISDLEYPEFYDVKLTNRCMGRCMWCYQDSKDEDKDYEAVEKLNKFFDSMDENQKPFQIAYGGGELSSSNETTMSIIAKNKERSAIDIMDLFFNLFRQKASNG
jgi:MoaA/NifB/PqqE/SkfB family radical SAM enzyme